LKLDITSNLLI